MKDDPTASRRRSAAASAASFFIAILVAAFPALAAPMLAPQDKPDKDAGALKRVLEEIDKQRTAVVDIQRELVARPALSPQDGGEGEQAKALWIEGWLREKRLPQAERIDVPDERVPAKVRPNLIIRYPGAPSARERRTLWIVSHLDVSPPGPLENWAASPWTLRVDGDTIYGRGVGDKHQAIVSALLLMESLSRNRIVPPLSLGLVLTAGEKTDLPPKYGIAEVLRSRRDIFRPGDLIVVSAYGNEQGTLIDVAEKDILWLKMTVAGRQAYSYAPAGRGVNALDAGAAFIMDLRALPKRFSAKNPLFAPPVSTFAVTRPESEKTAVNQIPGMFTFYLDCRLLPGYTTNEVETEVRKLADAAEKRDGVAIDIDRIHERGTTTPTSPDAPVVRALARAVAAQFRRTAKPVGMSGVSQAFSLRAAGLPVAVWTITGDSWSVADERISIGAQIDAAKIFARILFDPKARSAAP